MTYRVEEKKWILYRHTNNMDIISAVAGNLKKYSACSISNEDKKNLLLKLKQLNYYKERNPELPLDAINHRINTLAYYMFGYKQKLNGENKFLFSPLGNLYLKYLDDKKKNKFIFLTMLWAIQYNHPHGGTDDSFNLYPFRLVFKLISDKRLNYELSVAEFAYYVVFVKEINGTSYEKLVSKILDFRKKTNEEIKKLFLEKEHVLVNAVYEWDYYVSNLLKDASLLDKKEGDIICKLTHGKSTTRFLKDSKIRMNKEIINYCLKLEQEFPYDLKPLDLYDPNSMTIDVIKKIYNFYPKILLEEIGETEQKFNSSLLELPKLIDKYSKNLTDGDSYLFENILEEGFNMFYDVEAQKIAGAGNTDIECLYITKKTKFAVEAKSTKNKLSSINAGRLERHREKIGGVYTIVITPSYVPSVKYDIKSTDIVILTASTFAEFLYNNIVNNIREISYEDFDSIIKQNLGKDISREISNLTLSKFAISN
jgi:type II restriction enzyme